MDQHISALVVQQQIDFGLSLSLWDTPSQKERQQLTISWCLFRREHHARRAHFTCPFLFPIFLYLYSLYDLCFFFLS